MWERAARHNPLSFTNYYYLDHRPFLPQDPTFNHLWRKQFTNYAQILLKIKVKGGFRILYLNNVPAADRERVKILLNQHEDLKKCILSIAFALSALLTGGAVQGLKKFINYKIIGLVVFGLNFYSVKYWLNRTLDSYNNTNLYYYLQKYEHLTVDNITKIVDPRRKYFQLDTSVYYRQTADEILHHGHDSDHHDHDTSTYYGPYPYDDHLNLNDVKEIERKIKTGVSIYDDPEVERLLDDPIDIKRVVRKVPTPEEYRKL